VQVPLAEIPSNRAVENDFEFLGLISPFSLRILRDKRDGSISMNQLCQLFIRHTSSRAVAQLLYRKAGLSLRCREPVKVHRWQCAKSFPKWLQGKTDWKFSGKNDFGFLMEQPC
jgi:hypothetical protein